MEKYNGWFSNWKDVQENFGPYRTPIDVSEPEGLIVASYGDSDGGYDGYADVLWKESDNNYGYVHGSHCSCFGLEDQWKPEYYTKATLLAMIDRAKYAWEFFGVDKAELRKAVVES